MKIIVKNENVSYLRLRTKTRSLAHVIYNSSVYRDGGEKFMFSRIPWKWETSRIDRYHVGAARVSRKTISEQISRWLAWFKSSLKFRRVVPRMLSTSNCRLTPGRRDGSSFRQIRVAMKHRISTPSVSGLPTPHMINTSYTRFLVASNYFCRKSCGFS